MKLLEEKGRMYGYEITQKVKDITKGELKITEGALYPALHKLEAEGVLEVEVESAVAVAAEQAAEESAVAVAAIVAAAEEVLGHLLAHH